MSKGNISHVGYEWYGRQSLLLSLELHDISFVRTKEIYVAPHAFALKHAHIERHTKELLLWIILYRDACRTVFFFLFWLGSRHHFTVSQFTRRYYVYTLPHGHALYLCQMERNFKLRHVRWFNFAHLNCLSHMNLMNKDVFLYFTQDKIIHGRFLTPF